MPIPDLSQHKIWSAHAIFNNPFEFRSPHSFGSITLLRFDSVFKFVCAKCCLVATFVFTAYRCWFTMTPVSLVLSWFWFVVAKIFAARGLLLLLPMLWLVGFNFNYFMLARNNGLGNATVRFCFNVEFLTLSGICGTKHRYVMML